MARYSSTPLASPLSFPQAETLEVETHSRANPHEARFVAALAAYLLRQGYAPSQLTILTPYCGQQLLIRRELHEQSARARASGGGGGAHAQHMPIVCPAYVQRKHSVRTAYAQRMCMRIACA